MLYAIDFDKSTHTVEIIEVDRNNHLLFNHDWNYKVSEISQGILFGLQQSQINWKSYSMLMDDYIQLLTEIHLTLLTGTVVNIIICINQHNKCNILESDNDKLREQIAIIQNNNL